MRTVHVIVRGMVQGVGFRMFVEREAKALGLDGWVRNRRDGTVEAVIAGEGAAVERLLEALKAGPPASDVEGLTVSPHEGPAPTGFEVRRTE